MAGDGTLSAHPAFDASVLGDSTDAYPVDVIVADALRELRYGVDAYFDTVQKFMNDNLTVKAFTTGCDIAAEQIEKARTTLAGCGVTLPNTNVKIELTTPRERLHEVGRWVYQFFDVTYPW